MEWVFTKFRFSYVGLIFLGLLLFPNLLWARRKPKEYALEEESLPGDLWEKRLAAGG